MGRRRSKKRRLTQLKERKELWKLTLLLKGGEDRQEVACFQAGPAARNQEIFAGADLDLG